MTDANEKQLDAWLLHTVETMLMRAHVLNDGQTKDAIYSWAKEIETAIQVIQEHNKTCPQEFVLPWPEGTDVYGIGQTSRSEDF